MKQQFYKILVGFVLAMAVLFFFEIILKHEVSFFESFLMFCIGRAAVDIVSLEDKVKELEQKIEDLL